MYTGLQIHQSGIYGGGIFTVLPKVIAAKLILQRGAG